MRFTITFNVKVENFVLPKLLYLCQTMSKFTAILATFLITFTALLIIKTLQIQHSCDPMIDWGGKISAKCQIATKDQFNDHEAEIIPPPETITKTQQPNNYNLKIEQKLDNEFAVNEIQDNSNLEKEPNQIIKFVQEHQEDEIGIIGGGIAAGTAIAIASAPITGAVLIGLGVWFLIKTGLKAIR